jgi:hypothetical protein
MIRIKVRRGRTHTLEQQVAFFRLPKRRCHERGPDGIGVAIERCNLGGVGEMNDGFRVAGLGGVDPHDDARSVRTWRWLQWILFGSSLLAIPAFYLELAVDSPMLHQMGRALYVCMVAGFAVSLAWMVHLSRKRAWFALAVDLGAVAVIFNAYRAGIRARVNGNPHFVCVGMPRHVCQRFLHDAENRGGGRFRGVASST